MTEDKEEKTENNKIKKKKYQKSWSVWLMVILIIAGGIYIASDSPGTPQNGEEVANCIAEKSTLYIQLGCHACKKQEEIFGDNYKYLDTVDCFYKQDKCIEKDITATPTWIIDGERYTGYKSIDKLKELTGC